MEGFMDDNPSSHILLTRQRQRANHNPQRASEVIKFSVACTSFEYIWFIYKLKLGILRQKMPEPLKLTQNHHPRPVEFRRRDLESFSEVHRFSHHLDGLITLLNSRFKIVNILIEAIIGDYELLGAFCPQCSYSFSIELLQIHSCTFHKLVQPGSHISVCQCPSTELLSHPFVKAQIIIKPI